MHCLGAEAVSGHSSEVPANDPSTMFAILLSADLMTASQAQGAAARAGCLLKTVANSAQLLAVATQELANQQQPILLILDLTTPGVDPASLVPQLAALMPRPTILAFGPHVHEARLQAAADAGCDRVLSRGQFHAQCEQILAGRA